MKKRLLATILTVVVVLGTNMTVFAVTPQYKPLSEYGYTGVPEIKIDIFEQYPGLKDTIDEQVKEEVKDIKLLAIPEITEATYHHKTVYYGDTNRLQVRWNAVDDATSYEIVVTKSDGTSRTYTSNYTSLIVKKGSDDFITECTNQNGKSAKVKVRAVKNDGEDYSLWTDDKTVSCNSIHFN